MCVLFKNAAAKAKNWKVCSGHCVRNTMIYFAGSFSNKGFLLIPEMCFGPESSKCEEQKLYREPGPIQDKQALYYKYDSGISLASKEPRLFAQTAGIFSIQKTKNKNKKRHRGRSTVPLVRLPGFLVTCRAWERPGHWAPQSQSSYTQAGSKSGVQDMWLFCFPGPIPQSWILIPINSHPVSSRIAWKFWRLTWAWLWEVGQRRGRIWSSRGPSVHPAATSRTLLPLALCPHHTLSHTGLQSLHREVGKALLQALSVWTPSRTLTWFFLTIYFFNYN